GGRVHERSGRRSPARGCRSRSPRAERRGRTPPPGNAQDPCGSERGSGTVRGLQPLRDRHCTAFGWVGSQTSDKEELRVNRITRDELQAKLQRGDKFKLVMTLPARAHISKRIPTSLHFGTVDEALAALDPDEEIVVYCAGDPCAASLRAYYLL